MANQKDKFGIFLTVIIVLLIVATGVYAFVYRERIAETIQKFTKKENKEVYEIRTTKKSDESFPFSSKSKKEENDLILDDFKKETSKPSSPPVFEPTEPSQTNLKEKSSNKTSSPRLSEPEDKFLDPSESPYKKSSKLTEAKDTEEELHSEFLGKSSKKKSHFKKKRKKTHLTYHKKTPLEKRVRELEEKFGVRSKKKSSLEKRISRLEKLEKRVSKLEKLASKQTKE